VARGGCVLLHVLPLCVLLQHLLVQFSVDVLDDAVSGR
jgi:hypothetical protein